MSFGRSGSDAMSKMFPSHKAQTSSMTRTNSSPGLDSSLDRPMRLAEIYVAAEYALQSTISDPELWKSFSSVEEFEVSNIVSNAVMLTKTHIIQQC